MTFIPTVCDGGKFGKHCNESCGKCLNDEQCHYTNGGCLLGCNPGYLGLTCTEGSDILLQECTFFIPASSQTTATKPPSPFSLI